MPNLETLVAIGFGVFLVSYAIAYRLERNYYNKHRQELTELLYGHDPFESDTKLSWSDHLIMSGGTFFGLFVAWRDANHKTLPKEGLALFAPNIIKNANYNTLSKNHAYLKGIFLAHLVIGVIFLSSGLTAFLIKT